MSAIRRHDDGPDEVCDAGADVGRLGTAVTATDGDCVADCVMPLQPTSSIATTSARRRTAEIVSGDLLDDDRGPVREHLGHTAHQLGRVVADRDHRVRALLSGMLEHQVVRLFA